MRLPAKEISCFLSKRIGTHNQSETILKTRIISHLNSREFTTPISRHKRKEELACDQSNENILTISAPEQNKTRTDLKTALGDASSPPDLFFAAVNSERHHCEITGVVEIPSSSPQNVEPLSSNINAVDCTIEEIQLLGQSKLPTTVEIPVSDEKEPAAKEDSSGISELPQGVSSQSCLKGTIIRSMDEGKKSELATG